MFFKVKVSITWRPLSRGTLEDLIKFNAVQVIAKKMQCAV